MGSETLATNGYKFKIDNFDELEIYINSLASKRIPAYVLAINTKNKSDKEIEKILSSLKYRTDIDQVGITLQFDATDTINLVVDGSYGEEKVKKIACKIYKETNSQIGIVKYEKQDIITLCAYLAETLKIAEEKGEKFHLYNPQEDSLEAILETDSTGKSLPVHSQV